MSSEQRARLEHAAELEGTTLSTLILQAADKRAQQVVREHTVMAVPDEVFDTLLARLDEPATTLAGSLDKAFDELPESIEQR